MSVWFRIWLGMTIGTLITLTFRDAAGVFETIYWSSVTLILCRLQIGKVPNTTQT